MSFNSTHAFQMPDAMILAGGLGTRLRSVVSDVPKVLAPIAGKPVLAHLLTRLNQQGVQRVILCLGYRSEPIIRTFGDSFAGMELVYSIEPSPLGTGGALRLGVEHVQTDVALVFNGDTFLGISLADFHAFYHDTGQYGAMALIPAKRPQEQETVTLENDCRISAFHFRGTVSGPAWINAGVYLLPRRHLLTLPANQAFSLERDTFPDWSRQGLYGYSVNAPFLDMGTPDHYAQAHTFVTRWTDPRPTWVGIDRDGTLIHKVPYLHDPNQAQLIPGVAQALAALQAKGLTIIVLSNQSGVGRGYFSAQSVVQVNEAIDEQLRTVGGGVPDKWLWCPHAPEDNCLCRKPKTGLLRQFGNTLNVDLARGVIIGDSACDVLLGKRAGLPSMLVQTGDGAALPDEVKDAALLCCPSLPDACQAILKNMLQASH